MRILEYATGIFGGKSDSSMQMEVPAELAGQFSRLRSGAANVSRATTFAEKQDAVRRLQTVARESNRHKLTPVGVQRVTAGHGIRLASGLRWENVGVAPPSSGQELVNSHLSFVLQQATGRRWQDVGTSPPAGGQEVKNFLMATALQDQTEFSDELLQRYGVGKLRLDHYIQVGEHYFAPAEPVRVFTQKQWDAFGVAGLRMDHFVRSGIERDLCFYFRPSQGLGDKANGCGSRRGMYDDNFETAATRARNDGTWALEDTAVASAGQAPMTQMNPARVRSHAEVERSRVQLDKTKQHSDPRHAHLFSGAHKQRQEREAQLLASSSRAADADADETRPSFRRALSKAEVAKKEREDRANEHSFQVYLRRQQAKIDRANQNNRLRHLLVVEGERARAAAGDKILDDEDRRLMQVQDLVAEVVEPLHNPGIYMSQKLKEAKAKEKKAG